MPKAEETVHLMEFNWQQGIRSRDPWAKGYWRPPIFFHKPAADALPNQQNKQTHLQQIMCQSTLVDCIVACIAWLGQADIALDVVAGYCQLLPVAQTRCEGSNWAQTFCTCQGKDSRRLSPHHWIWICVLVPLSRITPFPAFSKPCVKTFLKRWRWDKYLVLKTSIWSRLHTAGFSWKVTQVLPPLS